MVLGHDIKKVTSSQLKQGESERTREREREKERDAGVNNEVNSDRFISV